MQINFAIHFKYFKALGKNQLRFKPSIKADALTLKKTATKSLKSKIKFV